MTSKAHHHTEQPLVKHLLELRSRLMFCAIACLCMFIALFAFAGEIYEVVSAPLRSLLPEGSSMIATDVASPFFAPFKLAMVLSVFLSMPVFLHQGWSFISPGLYQKEKRLAIPVLVLSIALFYTGIAFAFYVVFPLIFAFFTSVGPESVTVMTDISSYLNFILKVLFAFGIAFQIPVATLIVVWSGITSVDSLSQKRPYIIVGCFIFGMLLTPPDVISQTLLAGPMWILFELGIVMARMMSASDKKRGSS